MHTKKEASESKGNSGRKLISDCAKGGNPNPPIQFPKRNKAAEKHGFYSRPILNDIRCIFFELNICLLFGIKMGI